MNGIGSTVDGEAIVAIDNNRMKAYLEITAPVGDGKPCSLEKAMQALANCRVVFGIDEAMVCEALQEHNWGQTRLVASGKEPQNGKDAQIVLRFTMKNSSPQVDEGGNVNYKELGLISNVRTGELLAEKILLTEGQPGMDVTGQEIIPRKGKDINLGGGKNTAVDPSGRYLFAQADGHATVVNNRIQVSPVFDVKGDVDYSSGDINFVGTVRISGNVMSGFKVKSEGDIEIGGSIEGAQVIAEGSVLVRGGITGGAKGFVKAGGNISARFVENARLEAGLSVLVREAIIQSQVKAGSIVKVTDKKAIIVGGVIQAGHEVESRTLGSQLATQTVVEVGVNPHYRDEYQQITRSRNEKKKTLENISNSLQSYQRYRQNPEQLNDKQKQALMKLLDVYKALRKEVDDIEQRIKFLENELEGHQFAQVKAHDIAYPGVRISIGKLIYIMNDPVKYSAFAVDRGEIRVVALR
ncbi:MAG: FapA family protein [Syntrophomonadaceae bacterium]|jgi:uncharacterized protein (DUF342 family)